MTAAGSTCDLSRHFCPTQPSLISYPLHVPVETLLLALFWTEKHDFVAQLGKEYDAAGGKASYIHRQVAVSLLVWSVKLEKGLHSPFPW